MRRTKWRLDDGSYVIGRHSDCALRVADGRLSRHHARLTLAGDRAQILDLNSRNGVYVDDEQLNSAAIGPESNVRVGPFRITLIPLHPDIDASGDAEFMPLSASGAPRQALTDTFNPEASSSVVISPAVSNPSDRRGTADMLSDAFAPEVQTRLGGSALASPSWLRLATMRESSAGSRIMAYLGDVGLQLPIALFLASVFFFLGLSVASFVPRDAEPTSGYHQPPDQPDSGMALADSVTELLTHGNRSVLAIWYLSASCGLLTFGGYLAIVLILPTLTSGGPYWHRHYHLGVCTRGGNRPAAWQVCLRWVLSLVLLPLNIPLVFLRLPGLHDLLCNTRLRSS